MTEQGLREAIHKEYFEAACQSNDVPFGICVYEVAPRASVGCSPDSCAFVDEVMELIGACKVSEGEAKRPECACPHFFSDCSDLTDEQCLAKREDEK